MKVDLEKVRKLLRALSLQRSSNSKFKLLSPSSPVRQFILTPRPKQTDMRYFLIIFPHCFSHLLKKIWDFFQSKCLPKSPLIPNLRFFKIEKKILHLPRQKPRSERKFCSMNKTTKNWSNCPGLRFHRLNQWFLVFFRFFDIFSF